MILKSNRWLLSISFVLCTPWLAFSQTTWTVATDGDVNNAGTRESPFPHVHRALLAASPGDTIEVRGGYYYSDSRIDVNKNDITIKSADGEWAILEAPLNLTNVPSTIFIRPEVSGIRLERLEIIGGYYYGVFLTSQHQNGQGTAPTNISIINCSIHSTGRDCIKLSSGVSDVLIEGNRIFNSGIGPSNPLAGYNAEGVDIVNSNRVTVRGNFVYNISTTGMYTKGGSRDNIFENNLIMNVGNNGIVSGYGTDRAFTDPQAFQEGFKTYNHIIRNNIIINTGMSPNSVEKEQNGILLYSTKGARVYNNTIINAGAGPTRSTHIFPIKLGRFINKSRPEDTIIMNNLVYQGEGYGPTGSGSEYFRPFSIAVDGNMHAVAPPLIIDNNMYYDEANRPMRFGSGNQPVEEFWWQNGFDLHGVFGEDPLFVEINHALEQWNLQLSELSPARARGGNTDGMVLIDFGGDPRPQNNPDIGADQFSPYPLVMLPGEDEIGTGWDGSDAPPAEFAGLRIVPERIRAVTDGEVELVFEALDQYGRLWTEPVSPDWAIENPDDHLINAAGTFLAGTSTGSYTVTASFEGAEASTTVVVGPEPVATAISLQRSSIIVHTADTAYLRADVLDQLGEVIPDALIEWAVASGDGVISETGVYQADFVSGTATIEARYADLVAEVDVVIQAPPPPPMSTGVLSLTPAGESRNVPLDTSLVIQIVSNVAASQASSDPDGLRLYRSRDLENPIFQHVFRNGGDGYEQFVGGNTVELEIPRLEPGTYYTVIANDGWIRNSWGPINGWVEEAASPSADSQEWKFSTRAIASIDIFADKDQLLPGAELQLAAVINLDNGETVDSIIRWSVEGPGAIDSNGLFVASETLGGLATITARAGDFAYAEKEITVVGVLSYFPDSHPLVNDGSWMGSQVFGNFNVSQFPWLYFRDLGWQYLSTDSTETIWMYDPDGQIWRATSVDYFPIHWNATTEEWEL